MARTRVFVGSSTEGLEVAYSIQENLDRDLEVTVWPQGVFAPTKSVLSNLLDVARRFDAGVFVFSPDDIGLVRGTAKLAVRDNVLFELGLFIGQLGPERCFIVRPRSLPPPELPTDLLGVVTLDYNDSREDGNLTAALGPACNRIRLALGGPQAAPRGPAKSVPLEEFLTSQAFRLVFNPASQRSKRIRFGPDGLVTEGNNRNEHAWRITEGRLELVQLDGRVHSRFNYDEGRKRFTHTNEPDTLSIRGQYIVLDEDTGG